MVRVRGVKWGSKQETWRRVVAVRTLIRALEDTIDVFECEEAKEIVKQMAMLADRLIELVEKGKK